MIFFLKAIASAITLSSEDLWKCSKQIVQGINISNFIVVTENKTEITNFHCIYWNKAEITNPQVSILKMRCSDQPAHPTGNAAWRTREMEKYYKLKFRVQPGMDIVQKNSPFYLCFFNPPWKKECWWSVLTHAVLPAPQQKEKSGEGHGPSYSASQRRPGGVGVLRSKLFIRPGDYGAKK